MTGSSTDSAEIVVETLQDRCAGADFEIQPETTLAELGLDSLTTLRWRGDLERALGIRLPMTYLLGTETVGEVIDQVEAAVEAHPDAGEALTASQSSADCAVPAEPCELTVVQEAYWSGRGDDFTGGGVSTFWYHEYERTAKRASDDGVEAELARIETAWKRIAAAHPMLRTIIDRAGRPQIAVHDLRAWTIPRIDLRHEEPEAARARADELRERLSHQCRPTDVWPVVDMTAILLPGGLLRMCIGFDALLVDFASWGLIMRQWGELYARPHTQIGPPERTFAQAIEERSLNPLRQRQRARDRQWWAQQRIPRTALAPAEFPQTATRFARRRTVIEAGVWTQIVKRAQARGLSTSSVVLTAFALACHRWRPPETEETAAGLTMTLTVYDRPDADAAVVGDYSSTALLPLSPEHGFRPDSSDSFATTAEAVNRRFWDVVDHSTYDGIEVARDRPGEGPWPIVFTSGIGQSAGTDDRWLGDRVFGVSQTPQVLWDHLVWEEDGALVLTHDVVTSAFDAATIDGIRGMETALLEALVNEDGWERPAPGWDPTARPTDEPTARLDCGPLLHDPWTVTGPRRGSAPALLTSTTVVGHDALAEKAEALSRALRAQGVGPGSLVLIALPKGVDQIVAVLATMLTGAGYVPADPAWPTTRLETICERTGLTIAFADESLILPPGVERAALDRSQQASERRDRTATAHELAYVIFTSGSTGAPKGVAIEHAQARTTIDEINHRFAITSADRVFAISALSFDLSVYDLFGVLGTGGSIVLPDNDRLRDPHHWLEQMAEHRVTVWNSAPALMEMLLEYARTVPELARQAFANLRHVLLSGDWIPVTLPERLRALAPDVALHSLGGATEASIWSITYSIGEVDPSWSSIPYGRALPGQSFEILDSEGQPTPVGAAGELHIGGGGVARGYIGAPELTAERFIDRADLGTRLYRTGDLGRWRPDGQIEFLGRTDRQVKIGGHRIELGEVEAALLRLPDVRQASAAAAPGPDGRPRLVAYVSDEDQLWHSLPESQQRKVNAHLAEAVSERLPASMVPSRFLLLPQLPTTENGKIDYKALPNPFRVPRRSDTDNSVIDGEQAAPSSTDSAPSSTDSEPVEGEPPAGFHRIIGSVLGDDVDYARSLIDNGLTSVQAVRLANLVEDQGAARPSVQTLLSAQSVNSLIDRWSTGSSRTNDSSGTHPSPEAPRSARLDSEGTTPNGGSAPLHHMPAWASDSAALGKHGRGEIRGIANRLRRVADLLDEVGTELEAVGVQLPRALLGDVPRAGGEDTPDGDTFDLTEMQLAYLLGRAPDEHGRRLAPHFYTEAIVEGLDPDRLREAWRTVIAHHPMMRAVVTPDTRQRILRHVHVGIGIDDQRHLSSAEQSRRRAVMRAQRADRQLPTDTAPMAEFHVTLLDDQRSLLAFDVDLLFCDAASAVRLMRDLSTLYHDPHAHLSHTADTFSTWARRGKAPSAESIDWWSDHLDELPPPLTPPAPRASSASHFTRRRFELSEDSWLKVRAFARRHHVTIGSLMLHLLGNALSPHDEKTVMLTLSQRPARQTGVVGDFTSTAPLGVGGAPSGRGLADSLSATHAHVVEVLDHSGGDHGVHGNEVLRMLRAARRSASIPVAVSCALDPSEIDPSALLEVFGSTEYAISQTPHVTCDVQMFDVRGRFVCNVDVDESLVDLTWVDTVVSAFSGALRACASSSEHGDLPAMSSSNQPARIGSAPAEATYPSDTVSSPISTAEEHIEEVFTDLLGLNTLDWNVSWFEQGATSVTLVSAQRLLAERGCEISVVDLFAHPTPAQTSAHLEDTWAGAARRTQLDSHPPSGDREEAGDGDTGVSDVIIRARRRGRRRRMSR